MDSGSFDNGSAGKPEMDSGSFDNGSAGKPDMDSGSFDNGSSGKPGMDSDSLNERIARLSPVKRALLEQRLKQRNGSANWSIPRRKRADLCVCHSGRSACGF